MKKIKKERKPIQINGQKFMADVEFIPLLKELNKVGLKTTAHCAGHPEQKEHKCRNLSIEITKDIVVAIRNEKRPRLIIQWKNETL